MKIIDYAKKEKISQMKSKKFVIYAKKNLVLMMKMMKMHLNYTIKSNIIVITLSGDAHSFCKFKIKNTEKNSGSIS